MTQLTALAEKVEGAEGASRELDALIRCALFAPADAYVELSPFNGAWCVYSGVTRDGSPRLYDRWPSTDIRQGCFTASLDAAMMLVPEDCFARIFADGAQAMIVRRFSGSFLEVPRGFAATPALALTAAALRAQAALSSNKSEK